MKYNRTIITMVFVFLLIFQVAATVYAQKAPTYYFVKFDVSYKSLKNQAEKNGYLINEKDIKSIYGESLLLVSKSMNFYTENIYLFFNEKKELIYFNIDFSLKENQPRRILEELYSSIKEKLFEKYGENDNTNFPFYKIIDSKYEIFLHPFQVYSNNVEVSFKSMEVYSQYQDYYNQQIKKLETEDINKTVNNF